MSAADQIDELYQQPLSEFTRARNALAKTLGGDAGKRVRALEKPTVVAWAVNQVFWRARVAFDRVMKGGAELRKAQLAALQGRTADVRSANDAHRRAIADAVAAAERIAAESGSKPSPDALARTFEALSLAASPPEPPGRLADALQPAGFEALAGITPKPGAVHAPANAAHHPHLDAHTGRPDGGIPHGRQESSHRAGGRGKEDAKAARAREAEERRREIEAHEAAAAARRREAEVRKADAAVARAEAAEKLARASWEHAHDALLEARRRRDDIKKGKST